MGYKIIIEKEEVDFVPNDSHLSNHNLTYNFINSVGNHLNFFLPPISGLTDLQLKMTINIFSVKADKVSLFIFSNQVDFINENTQIYTEYVPESTVQIKIENGKWIVKTEKMVESVSIKE